MSKNTQDITVETFEELIKKPGILMLDFWATWCPPCRMFGPIFEAAAGKHTDITWGKIDTDAQQDLARAFHVQSIPTRRGFP
jgi:thioredoxin 1